MNKFTNALTSFIAIGAAVFCLVANANAKAAVDSDNSSGVSRTLPVARPAMGISETKPTLGVIAGITNSADQRRTGSSIALEYAFQPYIPFGAAVEFGIADQPAQQSTLQRTKLLYKGNYNFGGTIPVVRNSYVGLGFGPIWDRENGNSDVELGVAPQIGFDIKVGEEPQSWSLGANADYLFVGGAKSQVFALNGVAKYWF